MRGKKQSRRRKQTAPLPHNISMKLILSAAVATNSEPFSPKGMTQRPAYCHTHTNLIIFMCSLLSPLCLPTKENIFKLFHSLKSL